MSKVEEIFDCLGISPRGGRVLFKQKHLATLKAKVGEIVGEKVEVPHVGILAAPPAPHKPAAVAAKAAPKKVVKKKTPKKK